MGYTSYIPEADVSRTYAYSKIACNRSGLHSVRRLTCLDVKRTPRTTTCTPALTTYGPVCCVFSFCPQVDPYILPSERGKSGPSEFESRCLLYIHGAEQLNGYVIFTQCSSLFGFGRLAECVTANVAMYSRSPALRGVVHWNGVCACRASVTK